MSRTLNRDSLGCWYYRYPPSNMDACALLTECGVTVDDSTTRRWERKFDLETRDLAYGAYRS